MQSYSIMQGGQAIGSALVTRKGLYLLMDCHCQLSGEVMHDLILHAGNDPINLGLMVPSGNGYSLKKQIPVKRIGQKPLQFSVVPRHQAMKGLLMRVCEGSPFTYLSHLEEAFLVRNRGEVRLLFPGENNAKNHEI